MNLSVDELKKKAGAYAASYVQSGMIVGLGAGSTARWALVKIAEKIQYKEIRDIRGVPCSVSVEKEFLPPSLWYSFCTLYDMKFK